MKKEQKGQIIDIINETVSSQPHLYVTDIAGLNAEQTSKLRRVCFTSNVKLLMVKNTLLKKALESRDVDYSEIYPTLKGTTAIMVSEVNNAPAKLIKEFRKDNELLRLKGAYVEESFYIGEDCLDTLVAIKSKAQLLGEIIGMLQSPVQNVLGSLQSAQNTVAGVVKTLSERPE